jgi:hypothetical protein
MRPTTPPDWKQPEVLVALQAPDRRGSLMKGNGLPLLSVDCEKSPYRSSAVGSRNRETLLPPVRGSNSWL